eukprot:TRINITY_DN2166_c0_g1_i2.p1 TRINITY_DN2166_c0_g1~~TRINITY_DN2166_c0_g1_i2.p1  ORF type:complete len:497 (+),score=169.31 TRINITY_DN2166_c0_g1_i2:59-1492(+)
MRAAVVLACAAGGAAHFDASEVRGFPAGYDPTRCWSLDDTASLPSQCLAPTWSLDPPCPKCWTNPHPDYTPGAATDVPAELKALMKDRLEGYLAAMLGTRPASHADSGTVFSGHGGRALLLLKLHEVTGNATYLQLAAPYVDAVERALPGQILADMVTGFSGFQWSHVGMACVSALAADRRGDAAAVKKRIAQVQAAVRNAATFTSRGYDDFDAGRAGLLYAARFLEANVAPKGVGKVDAASLDRVVAVIIARGEAQARAHGNAFLQWRGPNDAGLWLGQSHGASGTLGQVLAVPGYLDRNATAKALVRATLDHICDKQFPSGNFPGEYYNETEDVLVQWDHGAPGVSAALLAGWKYFKDTRYLDAAAGALDCTWRRGLLLKGLMNCHGIGGNTWMQLHAAQATGNRTYAYRAVAFQETVLRTPLLSSLGHMRQPQPLPNGPWQFWTGSVESAIELWADLVYRGAAGAQETGFSPLL